MAPKPFLVPSPRLASQLTLTSCAGCNAYFSVTYSQFAIEANFFLRFFSSSCKLLFSAIVKWEVELKLTSFYSLQLPFLPLELGDVIVFPRYMVFPLEISLLLISCQ